jgi:hypothetical protein
MPLNDKSSIYRLNGVGHAGGAVIAKQARQSTMLVERVVHEEILPTLPLSRLHYFGHLEEKQTGLAWLFLEEATGLRYDEITPAHRALASEWLGTMHAATAQLDLSHRVPHLKLTRYFTNLQQARQTIVENLGRPIFNSRERGILETIIRHCDAIESRWDEIECFWGAMPACLVHSDFIAKNVRVRIERSGARLLVMDWEYAGWGVSAEDVAGLDTGIYWSRIRDVWSDLTLPAVRHLEILGRILQSVAWIRVTALELASDWADTVLPDLELYEARLACAREAAGWK